MKDFVESGSRLPRFEALIFCFVRDNMAQLLMRLLFGAAAGPGSILAASKRIFLLLIDGSVKWKHMELHQLQMALLVPDKSLLCFWLLKNIFCAENVTFFIWDRWRHLMN